MNIDKVAPIADAVLYEGHTLYPYRPSARKNQVRWTFGGVHPRAYSEANGGYDACEMQTEFLLRVTEASRLEVMVRFLHLVNRTVGRPLAPGDDATEVEPGFTAVESHTVGGQAYYTWEESREQAVSGEYAVSQLLSGERALEINLPAARECEYLDGGLAVLVREQESVRGTVSIRAAAVAPDVARVRLRITNETPVEGASTISREAAMRHSFISTHAVMEVSAGGFVSLTDPPQDLREAAQACVNQGAWPVMVGSEGDTDMLLASPIILEDYPKIAPQSPGNLFDGAEIDEILTLRILTMTDEEKAEARAADPEVRALLDRTEALTMEQLMNLHGVVRGKQAWEGARP